jgi:hypothetical protein
LGFCLPEFSPSRQIIVSSTTTPLLALPPLNQQQAVGGACRPQPIRRTITGNGRIAYRVFSIRKSVHFQARCYPNMEADTLLGFSPSRVHHSQEPASPKRCFLSAAYRSCCQVQIQYRVLGTREPEFLPRKKSNPLRLLVLLQSNTEVNNAAGLIDSPQVPRCLTTLWRTIYDHCFSQTGAYWSTVSLTRSPERVARACSGPLTPANPSPDRRNDRDRPTRGEGQRALSTRTRGDRRPRKR